MTDTFDNDHMPKGKFLQLADHERSELFELWRTKVWAALPTVSVDNRITLIVFNEKERDIEMIPCSKDLVHYPDEQVVWAAESLGYEIYRVASFLPLGDGTENKAMYSCLGSGRQLSLDQANQTYNEWIASLMPINKRSLKTDRSTLYIIDRTKLLFDPLNELPPPEVVDAFAVVDITVLRVEIVALE